ncbi:MAG: YdcF family protein [Proteobacteria bacterium]|nr:YdcF family protein [Pseudomonadota bacterium]
MKQLTPEFLKQIGEYLLVETPLAKADVGLVFGNSHADHLAEQAADLYHRGYFNLIVVSGGVATDDGRLEAHRMRDVLVAKGVPGDKILVEDKAANSGENVVFSMALLDKKVGLDHIDAVLAIGHIQAARRFLMTLERHWPQVVKMFATQNCFGVPKDKWYTDPDFKKKVLDEYRKIAPYKTHDLIREINLADVYKKIAARPQPPRPNPPAP